MIILINTIVLSVIWYCMFYINQKIIAFLITLLMCFIMRKNNYIRSLWMYKVLSVLVAFSTMF